MYQQMFGRCDVDVFGVQVDQVVGGEVFEIGLQFGEVIVEVDVEFCFDIFEGQFEVVDQLLDYCVLYLVVVVVVQVVMDC